MSSTDKRIVEMQFDNKQFERGIQTSTKSLETLNKTLQMDGASKGMSALERAVETVTHRFSALGIMGDQILRNITNSAYHAGKRLISSLSTDQITAGMSKYEQKTASVQTIMNATGKSIEEVNGYLEKLMWFSDETSYGFTDMTSALATMVSSGGDIDKLIPMITGVANATAFAGKGAAEFGRIMQFGINQAYSLGHMQVQDWRSIEGATVNSKQLMESLISAGEAAGAIKKGEITTKNFRQSLADKWLNTTVMEEGFGRFSALSEAAYEAVKNKEYDTASEAIEALAGNFDEISVKAFKAAQTAKSFSEAIAATKDAVSSGWMRTFEIIFGNFEEATALWTEVTGVLWGVFAAGSIARNELLKNWKDIGGRDNFLQGIRNTWNSIYTITKAIGDAFKTIFPPMTAERLASMSKSFEAFTESVLDWLLDPVAGVTRFEKITKIFKGFFSIFDIGKTVIKGIAEAIGSVLKPILPVAVDGLLDFFVVIADAISNFAANLKTNETFQNITKAIGDTVSWLVGVLGSAWNDITIFISKIWKYWFKPTLRKTQTSAGTTLIESGTRFKDFIDTLQPYIQKVKDFVAAIPSIVSAIWEFGKRIYTYLSTSEDVKKWVESFKAFIEPFIAKIKAWRTRLKNALRGLFGEKGLDKTKSFWVLLKEQFATTEGAKQFIDNVVNLVKTAWETIKKKIAEIFTGKKDPSKDWLRLASGGSTDFSYSDGKKASEKDGPFAGIFAFLEGIWTWIKGNWGWFAGGAIAIVLVKVFNLVNTWSKLGKIIARGKYPSQLGNNALKIAGAISAMIGGIYLLTTLDQDKMKEARKTVIIVGALLAGLSLIGSIPGLKGARLGAGMLGMSAGIMLIIMSIEKIMALFKSIGGAENWSELIPALTLVVGILALLAIMSKGLSGMEIKGKHGWKSIIALAGSVWLIVQALLPIATMEWEDLGKMGVALLGLTVAIGFLIGVNKHIGKYGAQKSKIAGMIGLAAGIWLIIKALKPVASMEWEDLGKMGAVLGGIVGILSLFILSSKGMNAAGAVSAIGSLVAMAAVIGVLGIALREVRDVSWEQIAAFTGGLTVMLIGMAAALRILKDLDVGSAVIGILAIGGLALVLGWVAGKIIEIITDAVSQALVRLSSALALTSEILKKFTNDTDGISEESIDKAVRIFTKLFDMLRLIPNGGQIANTVNFSGAMSSLSLASTSLVGSSALMSVINEEGVDKGDRVFRKIFDLLNAVPAIDKTKSVQNVTGQLLNLAAGLRLYSIIVPSEDVLTTALTLPSKLQTLAKDVEELSSSLTTTDGESLGAKIASLGSALKLFSLADDETSVTANSGQVDRAMSLLTMLIDKLPPDIKGSLLDKIPSKQEMGQFGIDLVTLAGGLIEFGIASTKISPPLIAAATNSLTLLANINTRLSQDGQIITDWNTSRLGQFAVDIVLLGGALFDYSEATKNITIEKVNAATNSLVLLANMNALIPKSGGFIQDFFGTINVSEFASNLEGLGNGLKLYAAATGDIDKSKTDAATNSLALLAYMERTIPRTGGLAQVIAGTHNLTLFATELGALGTALGDFAEATKGIDNAQVDGTANALKILAEMKAALPATGGLFGGIFGDENVGEFEKDLPKAANAIIAFADMIKDIPNVDQARASAEGLKLIAEAFYLFSSTDLLMGTIDVDTYSKIVEGFGYSLNYFNTMVSSVNFTKLNESAAFLLALVNVAKLAQSGIALNGDDLQNLIDAFANLDWTGGASEVAGGDAGADFVSAMVLGIQNGTTDITTAITTLLDAAIVEIKAYQSKFETSAMNLMAGLSIGITKYSWMPIGKAKTVAQQVLDALNLGLEVNSPSDASFRSGVFLVDGLVSAIETEGDRAVDAAVSLGESVAGALDDTLQFSGIARGGGSNRPILSSDGGGTIGPIQKVVEKVVDTAATSVREIVESGDSWWTKIVDALTGNTDDKKDDKKTGSNKPTINPPTNPTINPPSPSRVDRVGTVGVGLNQANELAALLNKLDILNSNVSGMQIIMDSGALVGQIGTKLDKYLGANVSRAGRG